LLAAESVGGDLGGFPEGRWRWRPVKLANDAMLAGVAFAIGMLLAVVFPTRREFDAATDALPEHAYSAAYLEVIVKANPRDVHSRLAYARQLGHRGDFQAALDELDRIPLRGGGHGDGDGDGDSVDREAIELRFDVALARARALPEGGAARQAAFDEVGRLLAVLELGRHAPARLAEYAEVALGLERPAVAASFYRALASRSSGEESARWLATAGRWLRAAGDSAGAAAAYQQAAAATASSTSAAGWSGLAVRSLEEANRVALAYELASQFAANSPGDVTLLAEAARLALAAGHPLSARDLGRRLLRLRPSDLVERDRQGLRELAAGDAVAALPWIRDAVRRHPTDPEWRTREAHVAEWAGVPTLAMKDWVWLTRRGSPHHHLRKKGKAHA
jgi:tetratricopeptide (TPR) repeat protein